MGLYRKDLPSQEELRELLDYNPKTGVLKFKPRGIKWFSGPTVSHRFGVMKAWNTKFGWKRAGSIHTRPCNGYVARKVVILGVPYREHRIIWKWMTGEEPPEVLDHIDGDACNNKWNNIQESTHSSNQRNKGRQSNNTSGTTGVTWDKSRSKWKVAVKVNRKMINCGRYDTYEEAREVALRVRKEHGFSENHGKDLKYINYEYGVDTHKETP